MASTVSGRYLTEQHRQAQLRLRDAFLAELVRTWPLLDWARLDDTGPAWVRAVMAILRAFRQQSADVTTSYYDHYRQAERPGLATPAPRPEFTGDEVRRGQRVAELIDFAALRGRNGDRGQADGQNRQAADDRGQARGQDQDGREPRRVRIDWTEFDRAAERALISAGPGYVKLLTQRGEVADTAMAKGLVATSGTAGRQVLNGGRHTGLTLVDADETALGWIRVTDGDPCYFCAMLAGRGPVYKSEATAGFQAHDHCACTAEPVFARTAAWPGQARDYQQLWQQHVAGRHSGAEARRAWRRLFEQLRREGHLPVPNVA